MRFVGSYIPHSLYFSRSFAALSVSKLGRGERGHVPHVSYPHSTCTYMYMYMCVYSVHVVIAPYYYGCHGIVCVILSHGFPQNVRVEWHFSERSKASNIISAFF